jgi:hypothetical protein
MQTFFEEIYLKYIHKFNNPTLKKVCRKVVFNFYLTPKLKFGKIAVGPFFLTPISSEKANRALIIDFCLKLKKSLFCISIGFAQKVVCYLCATWNSLFINIKAPGMIL